MNYGEISRLMKDLRVEVVTLEDRFNMLNRSVDSCMWTVYEAGEHVDNTCGFANFLQEDYAKAMLRTIEKFVTELRNEIDPVAEDFSKEIEG